MTLDDVWAGRVSARTVNHYIRQLGLIPTSRVAAIEQGDIAWIGWDVNTAILASTHNMLARFMAGDKADPLLIHPPTEDEPEEVQFPSVAEFSEGKFNEFMFGKG